MVRLGAHLLSAGSEEGAVVSSAQAVRVLDRLGMDTVLSGAMAMDLA